MTKYSDLKKIIPPDQALANEALSRAMRQVKGIFNSDLPSLSVAVQNLESNKGLPLINALEQPIPTQVQDFWANTVATGTGPGNTITVMDMVGIAAGNTTVQTLPEMTTVVSTLESSGALNPLTASGGSAGSTNNGVYTVMQFCLAGAYTSSAEIDPGDPLADPPIPPTIEYTVTIPNTVYFSGGSYSSTTSAGAAISQAFAAKLIPEGQSWIANIANANPQATSTANKDSVAIAQQIGINVKNLNIAGVDTPTVVKDIANSNFEANSTSTLLNLTTNLHSFGADIFKGGAAEFFEAVADRSNLYGQAIVSSMREGRNIEILNAVGITIDTQISPTSPDPKITGNLSAAQYTVAEAAANLKY